MNIHDQMINSPWLLIGHLIFWPFFLYACWSAYTRYLGNNSGQEDRVNQIWPILCAFFLLLWQLKASLAMGISIHLLGATLLTVLFGWQLAIIGLTAVLVSTTFIMDFNQIESWQALGLNGIILILIPVFVSYHIVRLIFLRLPHNFFIYIFLSGFANAMITLGIVGLSSTAILILSSQLDASTLIHHYLPAYFLIIFPEAFTTGAILTLFVVYRPEWVLSFDDNLYLRKN